MKKLKQAIKEATQQYRDGLISHQEALEQVRRVKDHLNTTKKRNLCDISSLLSKL